MRHYATHYPISFGAGSDTDTVWLGSARGDAWFTGLTASGTKVEDKVRTITEAKVRYDAERYFLVFTFSMPFLQADLYYGVGTPAQDW